MSSHCSQYLSLLKVCIKGVVTCVILLAWTKQEYKKLYKRHFTVYDWSYSLPENLCGAEEFTGGAVAGCAVTTETCIGNSIAGPGQRALEGAAQVVERPRYNDVVVETHQRGHTQHPDANTCGRRRNLKPSGTCYYCVRMLCKITPSRNKSSCQRYSS